MVVDLFRLLMLIRHLVVWPGVLYQQAGLLQQQEELVQHQELQLENVSISWSAVYYTV